MNARLPKHPHEFLNAWEGHVGIQGPAVLGRLVKSAFNLSEHLFALFDDETARLIRGISVESRFLPSLQCLSEILQNSGEEGNVFGYILYILIGANKTRIVTIDK